LNKRKTSTEVISVKLPKFWVGYVIAAIFIIAEIVEVIVNPSSVEQETTPILFPIFFLIGLGGWIYWFICVYKMHKVLGELTNSAYPITPAAAVGYHFIPFYNIFYWIFKWPAEIAKFVNARLERRVASKDTGVFLFLTPFIGRYIDEGIVLIVMFSVGLYLSRKILQVVQESNKVPQQQVAEGAGKFHKETKIEKEGPTLADRLMGRVPEEGNKKKRKK